jgi:hypothetical protein
MKIIDLYNEEFFVFDETKKEFLSKGEASGQFYTNEVYTGIFLELFSDNPSSKLAEKFYIKSSLRIRRILRTYY